MDFKQADRFLAQYDMAADHVASADLHGYAEQLKIWFACLDGAPTPLANIAKEFEEGVAWEDVVADTLNGEGLQGRSPLSTPTERGARIGGRLSVLRRLADGKVEPLGFGFRYIDHHDTSYDAIAENISTRVFLPLADELRQLLADAAEDALGEDAAPVVIVIDQTSKLCVAARAALERTIALVEGDNTLPQPTKARLQAEMRVVLQLIDQPETNIEATTGVLEGTHQWLKAEGKNLLLAEGAKEALSKFIELCKVALGGS